MDYLGNGRWGLKTTPSTAPKPTRREMPNIKYKAKYDEPPAKKKPAKRKKKSTRKSSARKTTTATNQSVRQPKKRLPKMKKSWWPFW